jgi:hypothetical protein
MRSVRVSIMFLVRIVHACFFFYPQASDVGKAHTFVSAAVFYSHPFYFWFYAVEVTDLSQI